LEQEDLKKLLNEGGYLWKNRRAGRWHTRLAAFKENRWRKGDSDQHALTRVLGLVWRQWCEANGIEANACLMHDIDWDSLGV
jgi:hypothetical protein